MGCAGRHLDVLLPYICSALVINLQSILFRLSTWSVRAKENKVQKSNLHVVPTFLQR